MAKQHREPTFDGQNRLFFQGLFQIDLPYCFRRLPLFHCCTGAKNCSRDFVIEDPGIVEGHQPACKIYEAIVQTANFTYHVENSVYLAVDSHHNRFQAYGEREGRIVNFQIS